MPASPLRLYHHSRQTFLSMTSQRALHSTSLHHLYPSSHPILSPTSPTKGDRLSTGFANAPLSPTKASPRGGAGGSGGGGIPFPVSPSRTRTISQDMYRTIPPGEGFDGHRRSTSMMSAGSAVEEGPITFREVSDARRTGCGWAQEEFAFYKVGLVRGSSVLYTSWLYTLYICTKRRFSKLYKSDGLRKHVQRDASESKRHRLIPDLLTPPANPPH